MGEKGWKIGLYLCDITDAGQCEEMAQQVEADLGPVSVLYR